VGDYPSIGLGFEMNEAIRLKKPVLAVAQDNAHVTRLVLGAAEIEKNLRFARYTDMKDVLELIDGWLSAK
jgi:hypothetical protein